MTDTDQLRAENERLRLETSQLADHVTRIETLVDQKRMEHANDIGRMMEDYERLATQLKLSEQHAGSMAKDFDLSIAVVSADRDAHSEVAQKRAVEIRKLEDELTELRKRPTLETYTLTLKAIEAQCEATKKAQSLLETACKDWADDDTEIKTICAKHGISDNDIPGEFKSATQCVEEMSIKLAALRTKAVEALATFGRHSDKQRGHNCRVMPCTCGFSDALTALRGDNAGGEG